MTAAGEVPRGEGIYPELRGFFSSILALRVALRHNSEMLEKVIDL